MRPAFKAVLVATVALIPVCAAGDITPTAVEPHDCVAPVIDIERGAAPTTITAVFDNRL